VCDCPDFPKPFELAITLGAHRVKRQLSNIDAGRTRRMFLQAKWSID
jgi:hypothetical protein